MHSIISQWLEIFFFLSVLLQVDLSETTFPRYGHYNSRYPKVRPFFENGTRLWSKDKAELILLSDSLKQLTYKGPCFPTCFPHFWTGRVTYLEASTEMLKKWKKTKEKPEEKKPEEKKNQTPDTESKCAQYTLESFRRQRKGSL